MNIKIILTGGGSAVANRLMTQAIAKIPPTIDCIFPAIEAYIVTPEELNTRLVRNLCGGIHFMHGPKKSWYLAAMPRKIERNGDACTILLTASTIQSQEEHPFRKNFLSSCLRCAWAQQPVSDAVQRAADAAKIFKQRPETLLVEELPSFILANGNWIRGNEQEMHRFYSYLLTELALTQRSSDIVQTGQ
jgi:hypothetical protein